MLRRSCAREVFEDNWSQGGLVHVCVRQSVCGTAGGRDRRQGRQGEEVALEQDDEEISYR